MNSWDSAARERDVVAQSPWPVIETYGELDAAEWIHTNGAGAYAMSTVPMMHTRRYHGILVAPLNPPLRRFVMLSHVEMTLNANGRHFRLSTHQFPGLAPTPGYRLLRRFAMTPIPQWTYRIGEYEFERNLCLARGRNIAVMMFTWRGPEPATLLLRPLLPLRNIHALMHEHGAMVQRVTLRQREVDIQPNVDLPPVSFRHSGVFVGSPDWWRRFEYLEDRTRAAEFQEDLWTPGTFELRLTPHHPQYLVTAVGSLPSESAQDIVDETIATLNRLDPGPNRPAGVRALQVAAEAFRVETSTGASIIAGYPWFGVHMRESMAALSGLCLVCKEEEFAKRVLRSAIRSMHAGFLPDILTETQSEQGLPSPDATLWLFEAAKSLIERIGIEDIFVRREIYPALRRAFVRFLSSRLRRWAWVTDEGLVANEDSDRPLTWMNAQVGSWIVTPRRGLAVESQALFSNACRLMMRLSDTCEDGLTHRAASKAAETLETAFRRRFWCTQTDYPFDCLSIERDLEGAANDSSIRPNAVMALALAPHLFESWQAAAILARARHDLLTSRGLRTLAPTDSRYQGYHEGGLEEREGSAHQGAVWPHLLGFFVRASVRNAPDDDALRRELRGLVEQVIEDPLTILHVSQMADGDAPHRLRACPAHGWAAGELLRALVEDLEY